MVNDAENVIRADTAVRGFEAELVQFDKCNARHEGCPLVPLFERVNLASPCKSVAPSIAMLRSSEYSQ